MAGVCSKKRFNMKSCRDYNRASIGVIYGIYRDIYGDYIGS